MVFLDAALTWLHVISAIGWLGAAMVFGMVIGPLLPTFSPAARSEFIVKVFPRYLRYAEVFAYLTLAFGVATAVAMVNPDFALLSPTNPFGLFISTGALLGLIALILALTVVIPAARKMLEITKAMTPGSGPPPPDLASAAKRLRVSSTAGMILLIVVTVFMVAAANV